ncbi:MAG: interleukin-like EMT inducer domain-containing protein, partial [Candidatus Omnitrophota bacterium]|nr:interleukin-like EMT inducer domain-containing protein [Candidatus Omnitrophota bacterium]
QYKAPNGVMYTYAGSVGAVTDGTVEAAQVRYDAALAAYEEKRLREDACQKTLRSAAANLADRTGMKESIYQALQSAAQSLNAAQTLKNARQSAYDAANTNYSNSKKTYDIANAVLTNAKASEYQSSQALTIVAAVMNSAKAILNGKVNTRKGMETAIANTPSQVGAIQTALANANKQITKARSDETAARNAYNKAVKDFNSKQTAYNNSKKYRELKEAECYSAWNSFMSKDYVRGLADEALRASIKSLSASGATKNGIQSQYNAANTNYSNSKKAYDAASTALATAKKLESDANKALAGAISKKIKKDIDVKQAAYNKLKQDRINKEAIFNSASKDLTNKTSIKNQAYSTLQSAIKSFNAAQGLKNTKQSQYNAANTNYSNAKKVYYAAVTVFTNAKTSESKANQALTAANIAMSGKKSALDSKVSARQALDATIATAASQIKTLQAALASANKQIALAKSEEASAQAIYNKAVQDLNAKQTSYNGLKQNRVNKEAAFNTASQDLTSKTGVKDKAYQDLQLSIQDLNRVQALKDAKQAEYNAANTAYQDAKTAYDTAVNNFNTAKKEKESARANVDTLLAELTEAQAKPGKSNPLTKEMIEKAGITNAVYDNKGALLRCTNSDGSVVAASYEYKLNGAGGMDGITIDRDGIKRTYNEYGNLSSLMLQDSTKIIYEDSKVVQIEKPVSADGEAGAVIKDFARDQAGNVTGCEVTETDGSIAAYLNGKIVSRVGPDGSKIKYIEGKIDTVESIDGKIYKYTYDAAGIRKDLIQYKLSGGSILSIKDGNVESVLLANGARLTNLVFDNLNNLKSADIILPGGGHGLIGAGELKELTLSDGTEIGYENGRAKYAIKADDSRLDYSYSFDASGNVREFTVKDAVKEITYGQDSLIKKVLLSGYTVSYEQGKIKTISSGSMDYVISDPVFGEDFKLLEAKIVLSDGNVCKFKNGRKETITRPDGTIISFNEKGDIARIERSGAVEDYIYETDKYGDVLSVNVNHNRGGVFKTEDIITYLRKYYNSQGDSISDRSPVNLLDNLSYQVSGYASGMCGNIKVTDRRNDAGIQDKAIKYEISYNTLAVNEPNASNWPTVSARLDFGADKYSTRLISIGIKETKNTASIPIFIEGRYGGYSLSLNRTDISKVGEWDNAMSYLRYPYPLDSIKFTINPRTDVKRDGIFYISDISIAQIKTLADLKTWEGALGVEPNNISEFSKVAANLPYSGYLNGDSLFAPLSIKEFIGATVWSSSYDSSDNLKQIRRSDGSVVNFASSKPANMIEPDGKIIDYDYDGLSIKRASIFPENNLTTPDVVVEYEFNRIKKAVTGSVTYSYAYGTAADGSEIIIIKNESTNYVNRYNKGILLSVTAGDGLVTEYAYSNNRIDKAAVSFNGKPQETFTYDYAGDLITVTSEEGIKRSYDKSNRLIFLETTEGLGYVYTYAKDDSGKDVLEVELHQSKGKDGIIIYHKDGKIDSIRLKDGTIVKIEDSSNPGDLRNMTINDGLVESVVYETGEEAVYLRDKYEKLDSIKVEKDGVARWYNTSGELIKLQKTPGEYYLYGYTRKEGGGIDKVKVSKVTTSSVGGSISPVKIYAYSAGYLDGIDAGIFISDRGYSLSNTNWWWRDVQGEEFLGRGHDVVVVDGETGKIIKAGLFDVWGKASESDRLAAFINSVKDGDYVIDAIADEGTWHLSEAAKLAIESIGSSL